MKRWYGAVAATLLIILLALSCAPKETPAKQDTSPSVSVPATPSATQKQGWEKEFEDTLVEARKEGKVVVYQTAGPDLRDALAKAFFNKYGITVESLTGTGAQVSEKIIRERKAGLYLSDLYQGGVTTPTLILKPNGVLDPLEPNFMIPDVKDLELIKKVWWEGKLQWVDNDHKILSFMAFPIPWLVMNTELVKADEISSYRDLLNPKWKGKIVMLDPFMPGPGGKLFSTSSKYIVGLDFWRDFAKQEPLILRDSRQVVEGVARGKYAFTVSPLTDVVEAFRREGAPLAYRMPLEGGSLTAGHGGLAIINNPPHPNASKIFINWILSKEAVELFSKVYNVQSARQDVPTDFLAPERRRLPDVKYVWPEVEDFLLEEGKYYVQGREIFGIR